MFGRKKQTPSPKKLIGGPAWDQETRDKIASSDHFNILITTVVKRRGFGEANTGPMREPDGYEISGIIAHPKYMLAVFNFDDSTEEFGSWFYHMYSGSDLNRRPELPFIEIWIGDKTRAIREAILDAHRAALISGGRRSLVRLWKKKGDGVFTAKD